MIHYAIKFEDHNLIADRGPINWNVRIKDNMDGTWKRFTFTDVEFSSMMALMASEEFDGSKAAYDRLAQVDWGTDSDANKWRVIP